MVAWLDRYQRRCAAGVPAPVVYKFFDDRGPYLAAMVTYYGFISLFPLTLLFLTALGFFLALPGLYQQLVQTTVGDLPAYRAGVAAQRQRVARQRHAPGTQHPRCTVRRTGRDAGRAGRVQPDLRRPAQRTAQSDPVQAAQPRAAADLGGAVPLSAGGGDVRGLRPLAHRPVRARTAAPRLPVDVRDQCRPVHRGDAAADRPDAACAPGLRRRADRRDLLDGIADPRRSIHRRPARTRARSTARSDSYSPLSPGYTLQALVLMLCAEINMIANYRLWPRRCSPPSPTTSS